jgi:hypothetical protein
MGLSCELTSGASAVGVGVGVNSIGEGAGRGGKISCDWRVSVERQGRQIDKPHTASPQRPVG